MLDRFFAKQGKFKFYLCKLCIRTVRSVPFSVTLYDSTCILFLVYGFLYLNLKTWASVCIGKHYIISQRIVRVKQIKPEKYHDEANTRAQQIQYVDELLEIDGVSNNTTENLK